jgi:hypothetical protein
VTLTTARPLLVTVLLFLVGGLAVALLYRHSDHPSRASTVGSGVAATQARAVAPFTAVELAGSNNVVLHVGRKQSVVVRGDDNLIRRITTKVRAATLVIGNTPGGFTTRSPMRVEVGVPTLSALTLSGSGTITGDGTTGKLDVAVTGRLDASVSGSGAIVYGGNPRQVTKDVTGTGAIVGG